MYKLIVSLFKWYYRHRARLTFWFRYMYLNEVNRLLEEHLTSKILQGGSSEFLNKARTDLLAKQGEIKVNEEFIEFVKKTK